VNKTLYEKNVQVEMELEGHEAEVGLYVRLSEY